MVEALFFEILPAIKKLKDTADRTLVAEVDWS